MAKKEMAVPGKKSVGKVVDYRTRMAKYVEDDKARVPSGGGGASISIKGKVFTFKGEALADPLKVIVLDYCLENAYYDAEYDPEDPVPPACFAIGKEKKHEHLTPDETSPRQQHESCDSCEYQQWGSAEKGRGKACKNNVRLAVISADVKKLDAAYIEGAEVAFMRLPPTSVKHISGHITRLTERMGIPIFGAVTTLTFEESAATPVVIPSFETELANDDKLMNAIMDKRETIQDELQRVFDVSGYVPPEERQPKRKVVKPVVKPGAKRKF